MLSLSGSFAVVNLLLCKRIDTFLCVFVRSAGAVLPKIRALVSCKFLRVASCTALQRSNASARALLSIFQNIILFVGMFSNSCALCSRDGNKGHGIKFGFSPLAGYGRAVVLRAGLVLAC